MAGFGIVGNSAALRRAATRLVFRNPRLLALLRRLISLMGGGSTAADDLINVFLELIQLLFRSGIATDLLSEFVGDWDWWDTLVLFASILAILFPGSAAVKVAFILAKIADLGLDLSEKYENYEQGLPLG